ncbi:hypothetical protein ABTC54_19540, partial [Acinetobacter baumannii]
ARELAQRAMQSTATWDGQTEFIATRLLTRPLSAKEQAIARASFEKFRAYYATHEDDARKFLNQGEHKPDPALPQPELAAMAMLTSQLLNLD